MTSESEFDEIIRSEPKASRFPREKVERVMNELPKPREEEESEEDKPQNDTK